MYRELSTHFNTNCFGCWIATCRASSLSLVINRTAQKLGVQRVGWKRGEPHVYVYTRTRVAEWLLARSLVNSATRARDSISRSRINM